MGSINVPPTTEYGMAVRMVDCDQCLVIDNLAAGPKPIRVWGKEGMIWPAIVDGRNVETEARVALATECLGHPLATMTLTVEARG